MTVRILDTAPAAYDLGQLRALAQTRFGAAFLDINEVRESGTQIAVYLDSTPNGSKRTAWTNDLAAYVVSSPTAADLANNAAALRDKAVQALTANATYLANQTPTNNQTVLQVQALTKQINGVIRQMLGLFDSTSGT